MTHPLPGALVGAEVRGQLAKKRVTHRVAMDRLQLSQSAFSRRLSGEVPFDVDELTVLAALLDIPVTTFLSEVA